MQNGCAAGAREAMDILLSEATVGRPYDIVILDMQLADVDGLMLASRIRKQPELAQTKLVLLTAVGQQFPPETLADAGIAACLVKPVQQSDLYNRVMEILSLGQQTDNPELRCLQGAATELPLPEIAPRPMRILLAEDNSVNQKVALRQLQKLGYRADAVSNGKEALLALENIAYDMILMDCHMPEMDGYEATRQLRQNPRTKKIRVIAMTANAMQGDREKCLAAGMDDYISKPVNLENLKTTLERNLPPAAGQTTEPPASVLNHQCLQQLRSLAEPGEPDPHVEFIDLFLMDAPLCLREIRTAVCQGQAADLRRLAHSLKGSSANLGAEGLSLVCRDLETAAKTADLESTPRLLERLESVFEQVKSALERERSRVQKS
jgi:CheY-like chemotaxis protein